MILLFEFIAVLILFVCLLYGIKYILLLLAKYKADKAFDDVFAFLPKLYDSVNDLFSTLYALSAENVILVENTRKLISQAKNFSIKKDGNERIIAYANSIAENVQTITDSVSQDNVANINIQKYGKTLEEFNKVKKYYNGSAQKLRHYVDVFPTSFFARLKKIKTMDYLY